MTQSNADQPSDQPAGDSLGKPDERPLTPAAGPPPKPAASRPAASKARKWRIRLQRTVLILLVLLVLTRIVIFFALGPVMRRVGALYGYDVTFDRQELTLLGGDVGLWYLKVTPKSGGQPVLQTDYLHGSISTIDLLKGRLYVERAEADGVDLTLERTADGKIPLLEQFFNAPANATPAPTTQPGQPQQLNFTPPLRVEAFRLEHVRAAIRDAAVTPTFNAVVTMNVRVNSLGSVDQPTLFDVEIWSDPLLDSMRITGQGKSDRKNLDASATVFMRGFHSGPLAAYLAPFGIRPMGNSLGADLAATIKTQPAAAPSNGVKATLTLDNIRLTADERDSAALTELQIDADSIDATGAVIGSIALNGGRLYAQRSSAGFFQMAGLELSGAAQSPSPAQNSLPAPTTRTASPAAAKYAISIRKISVDDMVANLHDQALVPANDVKAILSRFATTADQIDPNNPESVVPFEGAISLPGIARAIALQGSAKPFADSKTADLIFAATGIRLDVIKPYLSEFGVESLLDDAQALGHLTASLHADGDTKAVDARIDGLKLTQGTDLISMGNIQIDGAGIDQKTGRVRVRSVAIDGPQVDVTRDAAGRLSAADFRWTPGTSVQAAAGAPASSPAATVPSFHGFSPAILPRLQIDSFTWGGLKLQLRDEQVVPASTVAIEDAGVELKDIVFDLQTKETRQGTIRAWLNSPRLARQVNVDGTVQSSPGAMTFDVKLRALGIATANLAPYLKPLGIEPNLKDAAAQLDAKATLAADGDKLNAALDVTNLALQDGGAELGGVNALRIAGVSFDSAGLDIKSIHVDAPRAQIARETADSLTALGMRLTMPANAAQRAPATTAPSAAPFVLPFPIALHELSVTDGQLGWTDRTFESPAQTTGHATLQLSELNLGKKPDPAKFHAVLSAVGVLDEMVIDGTATPDPSALALHADIGGHGIRAGALAAYLPPGTGLATKDGQVKAVIDASITNNAQGGNGATLTVQNVDWRDGASGEPLLGLDSFHVAAPRVDLANNVIAIDEISLAGFVAQLAKLPDGSFTAGGIQLGTAISDLSKPAATTKPAAPVVETSTTVPAEDVAMLVAAARQPMPLMTLKKLDIGIRKIAVTDLSRPTSAPLAIENLQVRNTAPIEMAGPKPDDRPPAQLLITGQITPVVGSFTVNTKLAPFAQEPSVTVDVQSSGIRGDGVTELAPELKSMLNGGKLTDGRFKTQLDLHLKFERRSPRDFDLSRGFQMDANVNGLEFRDSENGTILAGLDAVHLEQARVQPATGSVIAKTLEIDKPQGRLFRDADGLHGFGFVVPLKNFTSPATKPSAPVAAAPPPPVPAPAAPGATSRPAGEIRIDRLVITGLDVEYEDRAVTPQFKAPLNGLDVEVRDLTSLAMVEPRTVRFSAIVNADKVSLPVAGSESATTRPMEDRPLFSQITSTGRLALYPKPAGYVKTSINGVELAAFKGLAKEQGIDLNAGIFDGNIDAAFADDGTLNTKSKLVLTDLQLHEPDSGPIARILKLPTPLDAAIKLVEAPDNSITLPLDVPIKNGSITPSAMVGAGLQAVSSVLLTAVASAPVKVVGGVADIFGLGGGKDQKKPAEPVVIQFAPGSTYLEPAAMAQLNFLILQAKKDRDMQLTIRHELGGADVALAAVRANPGPADVAVMAQQLRTRKAALEDSRSQLAGHLRGQLAALPSAQSQATVSQLRSLDQQIAGAEASMDELYDLMRPGAALQASRRTRAASLQIAQQRLNAVSSIIASSKIPAASDRTHPVAAQFNPAKDDQGGKLIITITSKGQGG